MCALVLRNAGSTASRTLGFASLNVRSLSPLKLDDLLVEFRDRSLDVLVLCETWRDSDSVSIRRLRADGFSVVERARPRRVPNSLGINHRDVAVVAAAGIRLTSVDVGAQPSTFEFAAARVGCDSPSSIIVAVYRPGSFAVTASFFTELADLWNACRPTLSHLCLPETSISDWSESAIRTRWNSV